MKCWLALTIWLVPATSAWAFSLSSTSTNPEDRAREISERRCATTFKRMQSFVKYWGPRPDLYSNYVMYSPRNVGFRGYDLLGDIYYHGCVRADLAPDKAAAVTWYQNAAIAHVPESQWKLGQMLYLGDGIEQDQKRGLSWITSAAIEGSSDAASFLRSIGEEPPHVMSPNTYETATMAARQQLSAQRAAQWREVTQDLGNLVVAGATLAATAYVGQHSYSVQTPASYAPTPTRVNRFRPVYCEYTANANLFYPNSVNVRITEMCY